MRRDPHRRPTFPPTPGPGERSRTSAPPRSPRSRGRSTGSPRSSTPSCPAPGPRQSLRYTPVSPRRFQDSIADQVRSLLRGRPEAGDLHPPRKRLLRHGDPRLQGPAPRARTGCAASSPRAASAHSWSSRPTDSCRKTYKALQFVEEQVVERGIRCLFVKSGVDSADASRWRMLLQIHAMTDEFVVGMYADNIRSAHEGLYEGGFVFGTISFGYRGREVPGRLDQARPCPPRPRSRPRHRGLGGQGIRLVRR